MDYTSLGSSSIQISRIGFGCMSLKLESEALPVLHHALELGINYFDTADLYDHGNNEIMVGKALRAQRKNLVIATKAGNQWRANGSGWDWNPNKDYILQCCEASLKRLGTDYIDLYQLHGGTIEDPIDETIEAFEQLLQQGKVRSYGISSIRPNVIREWVVRSSMVSVMMQYSLLDRRPEESAFPLLQDFGKAVLFRGSLAQGLLAGKPARPYLGHAQEQVAKASAAIHALRGNENAAATAIRFTLDHPAVSATVVGIRTMEQLQQAVQALELPPLSSLELDRLRASAPARNYAEHR